MNSAKQSLGLQVYVPVFFNSAYFVLKANLFDK